MIDITNAPLRNFNITPPPPSDPPQEFLAKINDVPTEDDGMTPKRKIKLVDCQAKDVKKYKIQRRAAAQEDSFDE